MNESSTVYLLPQTPPCSFVLTILQLNITYNLLFIYTYWYSFFTYWVFTNLPFNVFQQVLPTLLKIGVLKLYWTISLQFDNPRINMDNFTETIFNKKRKKNLSKPTLRKTNYIAPTILLSVLRMQQQPSSRERRRNAQRK